MQASPAASIDIVAGSGTAGRTFADSVPAKLMLPPRGPASDCKMMDRSRAVLPKSVAT